MYYTANPVSDAERYHDAQAAQAEAIEREEARIATDIRDTLTKHIRLTTSLTVPSVSFRSNLISETPVKDVIADEIPYGKPFVALMEALHRSDCPYVAAIRKAIADSYSESNAADIAGLLV